MIRPNILRLVLLQGGTAITADLTQNERAVHIDFFNGEGCASVPIILLRSLDIKGCILKRVTDV